FGIAIGRLLEPAGSREVRLIPASAPPVLWHSAFGGFARLLAGATDPGQVELWEIQLQGQDRYSSGERPAGTRSLIHVLVGSIMVTHGGTDYPLLSGETIDCITDRDYVLRNDTDSV